MTIKALTTSSSRHRQLNFKIAWSRKSGRSKIWQASAEKVNGPFLTRAKAIANYSVRTQATLSHLQLWTSSVRSLCSQSEASWSRLKICKTFTPSCRTVRHKTIAKSWLSLTATKATKAVNRQALANHTACRSDAKVTWQIYSKRHKLLEWSHFLRSLTNWCSLNRSSLWSLAAHHLGFSAMELALLQTHLFSQRRVSKETTGYISNFNSLSICTRTTRLETR